MGHVPRRPKRRYAVGVGALVALTGALTGCSQQTIEQWGRFGLPPGASDRSPFIGELWVGAWIAAMVVGVFVWGLIFWSMARYRRRHRDEVPRQTRYNLPMEVMYTAVPILIVGVLFFFTVRAQDGVNHKVNQPAHTVNVVGQKWSWTFNYMEPDGPVHTIGTIERNPDLYLVVNQPVRINLTSADVIHSFWVPDFYYKLDAIPGKPNSFDVTPTKLGTFAGKCAEFCGTYHSAMLFNVRVVSQTEFDAHIRALRTAGQTGEIKAEPRSQATQVPTVGSETAKEHG